MMAAGSGKFMIYFLLMMVAMPIIFVSSSPLRDEFGNELGICNRTECALVIRCDYDCYGSPERVDLCECPPDNECTFTFYNESAGSDHYECMNSTSTSSSSPAASYDSASSDSEPVNSDFQSEPQVQDELL